MKRLALFALFAVSGCAAQTAGEPSLAPRSAEAIDPRLPIPDTTPIGPVDAALAGRLDALVGMVRAAAPAFEAQEARAASLAGAAGPMESESWIAAQQALSRLVEQYGVTTQAAADIDALAAGRLQGQHWISPSDQKAIADAASKVASISNSQAASIARLNERLTR